MVTGQKPSVKSTLYENVILAICSKPKDTVFEAKDIVTIIEDELQEINVNRGSVSSVLAILKRVKYLERPSPGIYFCPDPDLLYAKQHSIPKTHKQAEAMENVDKPPKPKNVEPVIVNSQNDLKEKLVKAFSDFLDQALVEIRNEVAGDILSEVGKMFIRGSGL